MTVLNGRLQEQLDALRTAPGVPLGEAVPPTWSEQPFNGSI